MLIEFNDFQCSARVLRRVLSALLVFLAGKMLMFAKLSLRSFIYSLAELLMFPDENDIVRKIYDEYLIERILVFHILTDTDSTSIQFVAISKIDSPFTEPEFTLILFKIFLRTEIRDRFDKSDNFWKDLTYTTFQIKKF